MLLFGGGSDVFYHIVVSETRDEKLYINLTRENVLVNYVCPFINREVTLNDGEILNMVYPVGMRVFRSDQPVTTEWPINAQKHLKDLKEEISEEDPEIFENMEKLLAYPSYIDAVVKVLNDKDSGITEEIFADALTLLATGEFKGLRKRLTERDSEHYALFICPSGNEAVDQNYELVIKPSLMTHKFSVERADELASAGPVNEEVTEAIIKSKLIVVDLSGERPNCYYEAGFAHALGKPVIILAQTGTTGHFDLPGVQWHYWNSSMDLKPKFEKLLLGTLIESG
jgi:hypothetical protein